MKKEFDEGVAAESDRIPVVEMEPFSGRKRTKGGFILPPGLMSSSEYRRLNPDTNWEDPEMKKLLRWEAEAHDEYVVVNNPEEQHEYAKLRLRFAEDTKRLTDELKAYLQRNGSDILVNTRSGKGLSARQRELPKLKILLLPLFFQSASDEEKKNRMQAIPGVAECLMHFSEDGIFQIGRFHYKTGMESNFISMVIGRVISDAGDRITDAYTRRDFRTLAEIVGEPLIEAVRVLKEDGA